MQDMKLQDKISTILSTQEAQKRAWPHGTSATPSRCQSRKSTHLTAVVYKLLPVSPLTWKSSQSLQQVMPWLVAGRLRHLRRWWTRCGVTSIRLFLV